MENVTKLLIKSTNDSQKHSQQLLRIYEVHTHSVPKKTQCCDGEGFITHLVKYWNN